MVLDLPAPLGVDVLAITALNLIGNNVEVVVRLAAQKRLEESADDWNHAGRQHHDRDIVLLGPFVEFHEVGIQLHVLLEVLDALVVGGLDAVQHVAKSVTSQ